MDKILRPYQLEATKFLTTKKRCILADEMGLGKTLSALYAAFKDHPGPITRRILIVCSKNSLYTWKSEVAKWYPAYSNFLCLVRGQKPQRKNIWERKYPGIYITTYGALRNDIGVIPKKWDHIIADEAHKLRNRKINTFKAFKHLRSPTLHLITGTPASRGRQDLWTMFNLIDPKKYSSYWRYVNHFCQVELGPFGKEITGNQNNEEFKEICKDLLLARKMREVDKDLPIKIRNFPEIQLTGDVKRIYNEMRDEMVSLINELTGTLLISSSVLGAMSKMRQLLVCPKIHDESLPIGEGVEWATEHIEDNELRHSTIFSMYPSAFIHIRKYLQDKGVNVHELRGGMCLEDIEEQTTAFKRDGGVMLASIKFAESYSMEWCTTGYVLGYSFDPQENYQAESRLLRMNTKGNINLYYVKHLDTYDERVLEILNEKQRNVADIYKTPAQYLSLLYKI